MVLLVLQLAQTTPILMLPPINVQTAMAAVLIAAVLALTLALLAAAAAI